MKSTSLKEKTTTLLLFPGTRSRLMNQRRIKGAENNRSAVVFSVRLIDFIVFVYYFTTYATLFSESWCNGLLKCVSFTYQKYFVGTDIHSKTGK